jgi:hypothetical protein
MKLNDSPTERTTAATDVLLSLASAGGIFLLQSRATPIPWKLHLWSGTFALISLAAALGAVYHGLVLAEGPRGWLWRILTACLSMTISLFVVGVFHDVFGRQAAGRILPLMLTAGVLVYAVSRMFEGLFRVFIVYQTLALVLALSLYVWLAAQGTSAGAGWMATGVTASIIAAGIQTVRSLHVKLIWTFDRNGVFHLVQFLGVILLCVGLLLG